MVNVPLPVLTPSVIAPVLAPRDYHEAILSTVLGGVVGLFIGLLGAIGVIAAVIFVAMALATSKNVSVRLLFTAIGFTALLTGIARLLEQAGITG